MDLRLNHTTLMNFESLDQDMKVFSLEQIRNWYAKNKDGSYDVSVYFAGMYSSVSSAEKVIREIIAQEGMKHTIGYWLYEHTVDDGYVESDSCSSGKMVCEYDSVRAYLADGTLLCESLLDAACRKTFKGRDPKTLKLKPGDVAFEVSSVSAEPVLIDGLPCTEEDYQACLERAKKEYGNITELGWDYSDDSYTVYNQYGSHDHPLVWKLFPHFGKVDERVRERLQETKKWHDNMNEKYLKELRNEETQVAD